MDTSNLQLTRAGRTRVLVQELTYVTMPERLTLFDLLIQGKKKLRRREVFKHKSWQKNPIQNQTKKPTSQIKNQQTTLGACSFQIKFKKY